MSGFFLLKKGIKIMFMSELFTSEQAANYLGVTSKTLAVWRCVGRYNIPFVKVGRLVKYRKSELDAFLTCRTVGASLTESNGDFNK
jgi:excisionase family DNA binding protein